MGRARRIKLLGPWAERYEILQPLGSGGAGEVFLAKDSQRSGDLVALKLLDRKRLRDSAIADSLRNEFSSLTRLSHPHLAKVWDFGASKEEMFLSTEYVEGSDLFSACRSADLNTVFRRLVELLRGLDYLHRRGVLHLDLKPENILVADPKGGKGGVKLIDFGLAQWTLGNPESASEFSGSPPYSAPELLLGGAAGPATDLYAVGMIFYQLFSAGLPFSSDDALQRMQEQLYAGLPAPRQLNPALPDDFGRLMHRLIERDPKKRPQSVAELLTEINAILGENYSLRPTVAPARILDESDRLFFPECLETLMQAAANPGAKILLLGKGGGGKSRLLRHFKERLQLNGSQPAYYSDPAIGLDKKSTSEGAAQPLMLDLSSFAATLWADIENKTANHRGPLFVALSEDPAGAPEFKRLPLPPLDAARLQAFLSEEIKEFPKALADSLAKECSENPLRLEDLLQELRERHAFIWTEDGWRWNQLQAESKFSDLEESAKSRWEERWKRAQKLLDHFPKGLSADSLAGMMGLELGSLAPRLERWRNEGKLRADEEGPLALYFNGENPADQPLAKIGDSEALSQELRSLYEAGEFEAGCRIALAFTKQDPSPKLKLLSARHMVAAGRSAAALDLLPEEQSIAAPQRGLYFEVRARSLASLGRLDEALEAMIQAESAYRNSKDLSGLSRILNQRGWLQKKRGDSEGALGFYAQAAEVANQAMDDYARGLALLNAGGIHHDRGELESALDFYSQAQALGESSQHPLLRLKVANNHTNIYYTLGRSSEAERSSFEMLRFAIEGSFPEEQAAALNFLSLLAGQRGDLAAQSLYLDQAIALLENRPGSALRPQLYFNRGYLHWDNQRHTAAQIDAEAALQSAQELANGFIGAWAELLIGKVLRDRPKPDFETAQAHLENAAANMRKLGLGNLLWEAEFDLGLLAKRREDGATARKHLEAARAELRSLLEEIPESRRQSYLRDRKLEKIEEELRTI